MDFNIRSCLEGRRKEAVELLCDLIRMPSTRGNEGPVIRYLHERFRGRADACELVPTPESIVQDEDYSFPNQLNIPTLVMGPGPLGHAHTNEEQIAVDDLLKGAEVLVRLIVSWCGRNKAGDCGRPY